MTTIQDVNSAIISGGFTNDQLDSVLMALKFARGQLAKKNKSTMTKGSSVKWVSSKSGQEVQGTVVKVNRKFVIVSTPNGSWRVPANMLSVA